MPFPKRYLAQFGPKETQHLFADILVIGGGIAGLRAALAAPPSARVLVVTKDRVQQSNSTYAQGGIAAVRSPEDRFENHIEDTLVAGAGLCDKDTVDLVVREAPGQIDDLIRYGAKFDPDLAMEGGHSYHRIVHALRDRLRGDAGHHRHREEGPERHDPRPHLHPGPADARGGVRRGRGRGAAGWWRSASAGRRR